jgi:hypothetical protein
MVFYEWAEPVPTPGPRLLRQVQPRATTTVPSKTSWRHSIKGTATWYCLPGVSRCPTVRQGGLYAAISPDLGWLRGKRVRVCYRASCVVVQIVDCNCRATRSVDLFADAFRRLAPLGSGRLRGVTISWR